VNNPTPAATTLSVTSGAVARVGLLYDEAVSVTTSLAGPDSFAAPSAGLPLTVRSSYLSARTLPACPPTGTRAGCVAGDPPVLTGLFPAVYSVWAGTCLDAGVAPTSVDLTDHGLPIAVAVAVGAVTVDVRVAGVSTAGRAVTATHASDPSGGGGCPSGETYSLADSAVGGSGALLPYGTWTFSTPGATPVTATLAASGPSAVTLAAAS